MNRIIKFRAWDKKKKSMEYDITGFECTDMVVDGVFIDGDYHSLRDTEIMQSTGLLDKNGEEIFEGDVLKIDGGSNPVFTEVSFNKGCFTIKAPWLNREHLELKAYTFFNELDKNNVFKDCILTEIIGNIHDNPELLEPK